MRFAVIDVETANEAYSSICQIGVAVYDYEHGRGELVDEWETYVNPETEFRELNTRLHGIDAGGVSLAPLLPDVWNDLRSRIDGALVASYGPFDMQALQQASDRYALEFGNAAARWLDLTLVVRRVWPPEMLADGWALHKMCIKLGVTLERHHDAMFDAHAAAAVFMHALKVSGTSPSDWLELVKQSPRMAQRRIASPKVKPMAADSGPLLGQVAVFTGELSIARGAAWRRVAALGCTVADSVTRKTTMLIVGQTNLAAVGLKGKSTSQLKAEELAAKGQQIRIIYEAEFMQILNSAEHPTVTI